jgi:hypothetical protein
LPNISQQPEMCNTRTVEGQSPHAQLDKERASSPSAQHGHEIGSFAEF